MINISALSVDLNRPLYRSIFFFSQFFNFLLITFVCFFMYATYDNIKRLKEDLNSQQAISKKVLSNSLFDHFSFYWYYKGAESLKKQETEVIESASRVNIKVKNAILNVLYSLERFVYFIPLLTIPLLKDRIDFSPISKDISSFYTSINKFVFYKFDVFAYYRFFFGLSKSLSKQLSKDFKDLEEVRDSISAFNKRYNLEGEKKIKLPSFYDDFYTCKPFTKRGAGPLRIFLDDLNKPNFKAQSCLNVKPKLQNQISEVLGIQEAQNLDSSKETNIIHIGHEAAKNFVGYRCSSIKLYTSVDLEDLDTKSKTILEDTYDTYYMCYYRYLQPKRENSQIEIVPVTLFRSNCCIENCKIDCCENILYDIFKHQTLTLKGLCKVMIDNFGSLVELYNDSILLQVEYFLVLFFFTSIFTVILSFLFLSLIIEKLRFFLCFMHYNSCIKAFCNLKYYTNVNFESELYKVKQTLQNVINVENEDIRDNTFLIAYFNYFKKQSRNFGSSCMKVVKLEYSLVSKNHINNYTLVYEVPCYYDQNKIKMISEDLFLKLVKPIKIINFKEDIIETTTLSDLITLIHLTLSDAGDNQYDLILKPEILEDFLIEFEKEFEEPLALPIKRFYSTLEVFKGPYKDLKQVTEILEKPKDFGFYESSLRKLVKNTKKTPLNIKDFKAYNSELEEIEYDDLYKKLEYPNIVDYSRIDEYEEMYSKLLASMEKVDTQNK